MYPNSVVLSRAVAAAACVCFQSPCARDLYCHLADSDPNTKLASLSIKGIEDMTGCLMPKQHKEPYMARVDLAGEDDISTELAANGKKSWVKDLIKAVTRMPFKLHELISTKSTTLEKIEEYSKVVKNSSLNWLQGEINSSEKLYLLHGRREPQKDKGPAPK
ncbi:hypothetical protein C8J57DRAFT_1251253 [Mycena rebaudengoi]|nr:hypothetical protein C8J57DRAFT_1251253 [Mycena rebaudengoi]